MKTIELKPLAAVDHLVHPEEFSDIHWNSPATDIFTDFRYHPPQVVDQNLSALEAYTLMRRAHVHLLLVVDQSGEITGVVTGEDLSEERMMLYTGRQRRREELCVGDLMRERRDILSLEYESLRSASVRGVIELLKRNGQQYCLVVDSQRHHVRGLISASEVASRMHVPIEISRPRSFVDIFQAIRQ
jgi:CBS domain containing-hemolysin-like protein